MHHVKQRTHEWGRPSTRGKQHHNLHERDTQQREGRSPLRCWCLRQDLLHLVGNQHEVQRRFARRAGGKSSVSPSCPWLPVWEASTRNMEWRPENLKRMHCSSMLTCIAPHPTGRGRLSKIFSTPPSSRGNPAASTSVASQESARLPWWRAWSLIFASDAKQSISTAWRWMLVPETVSAACPTHDLRFFLCDFLQDAIETKKAKRTALLCLFVLNFYACMYVTVTTLVHLALIYTPFLTKQHLRFLTVFSELLKAICPAAVSTLSTSTTMHEW